MSCSHYTPALAHGPQSIALPSGSPFAASWWPNFTALHGAFARCMKALQPIETMSGSGREASPTTRRSGNPSVSARRPAPARRKSRARSASPARHSGDPVRRLQVRPEPPNGGAIMLMNHRLPVTVDQALMRAADMTVGCVLLPIGRVSAPSDTAGTLPYWRSWMRRCSPTSA